MSVCVKYSICLFVCVLCVGVCMYMCVLYVCVLSVKCVRICCVYICVYVCVNAHEHVYVSIMYTMCNMHVLYCIR